jgi:hypothetical protein
MGAVQEVAFQEVVLDTFVFFCYLVSNYKAGCSGSEARVKRGVNEEPTALSVLFYRKGVDNYASFTASSCF